MADMNNVVIEGNLTRDPELRYSMAGNAFCNVGVAWSQNKRDGDGWTSVPHYFDVTCFGNMAEHVAETFTKGARVVVVGRLDYQTWQAKDGGGNRSKVVILADSVSPSLRFAVAEIVKTNKAGGAKRGAAVADEAAAAPAAPAAPGPQHEYEDF